MGEVHRFEPVGDPAREAQSGNGNGGNTALRERVAHLESTMKHVAMREDVLGMKIWVLGGVIGGMIVAVSLGLAIARLFFVAE